MTRIGPELAAWAIAAALLGLVLGCGSLPPPPLPPPLPGEQEARVRAARPLAERGSSKAQTQLGVMYLEGRGVERDPVEAIRWLRAAADQGNAAAQLHLGLLHLSGEFLEKDLDAAAVWFRRAADQGRGELWECLSSAHEAGGVPLRVRIAFEWMRAGSESLRSAPTHR